MTRLFLNARKQTQEQKQHWIELFDSIAESLDLTASQLEKIETAYRGVGSWLANSDNPILVDAEIYSQGSVRIKTAVKPIGQDEFDVDLVLYLPNARNADRDEIMEAVRSRLNAHGTYSKLLSELPRGFRINYTGEYHLDITPGKEHEQFWLNGQPLWVPDKREEFKESNAKGFAEWFDEICKLLPQRSLTREMFESIANESVEELPSQHLKAPLNRIIQILKRHRDEWGQSTKNSLAKYKPISVLITTLATKAYKEAVNSSKVYDNDYDVILDVIELMPHYIEQIEGEYLVTNPSMQQENYAEKWNRTKDNEGDSLRHAFFSWHQNAASTFEELAMKNNEGMDVVLESLSAAFGEQPVNSAHQVMMTRFNNARQNNNLGVSLATGAVLPLSSVTHAAQSHTAVQAVAPVKANTFYGD